MIDIVKNINEIKDSIPSNVCLIAVSKTKPLESLKTAYDGGQRIFGENKAQEMTDKYEKLPKDIKWHFIGHLQKNKVKYIIPYVELIHAVDSLSLLQKINKEALKCDRVVNCLLQFHIALEETKFGMNLTEAKEILSSDNFKSLENINICGVMGMATNTDDKAKIHNDFHQLKEIFDTLKKEFFPGKSDFKEISMGMSGDYKIAIDEGSTMVRVGSSIFGARAYSNI